MELRSGIKDDDESVHPRESDSEYGRGNICLSAIKPVNIFLTRYYTQETFICQSKYIFIGTDLPQCRCTMRGPHYTRSCSGQSVGQSETAGVTNRRAA